MSDSMATTTRAPQTVVRKHPIRGLLWGLMFGIGLTLVLVITTVISLDLTTMVIVAVVGTVVGVLWGMFGPAKAPKGEPPRQPVHVEKVETSRFDDFNRSVGPEPAPGATDDTAGVVDTGEVDAGSPDSD